MSFGRLIRGYTQTVKRPQTRARLYDDGASEYLQYGGAAISAVPLTLACWFYSDTVEQDQALISIADTDGLQAFVLAASGQEGDDRVRARTYAGPWGDADSTTSFLANTWYHACAVFAAANDRAAFLDGGGKGTDVTNLTPANLDNTSIGAWWFASGSFWFMSGRIFIPAIWDAKLTDGEVFQLAQGELPWNIRPQSLVACWDEFGRNIVNNRFQMTPFNSPGYAPGMPRIKNMWMMSRGLAAAAALRRIFITHT